MTTPELLEEIDQIIESGVADGYHDTEIMKEARNQLTNLWNDMNLIRSCKVCAYGPRTLCDPDADVDSEAFKRWRACGADTKACWKWRMDGKIIDPKEDQDGAYPRIRR